MLGAHHRGYARYHTPPIKAHPVMMFSEAKKLKLSPGCANTLSEGCVFFTVAGGQHVRATKSRPCNSSIHDALVTTWCSSTWWISLCPIYVSRMISCYQLQGQKLYTVPARAQSTTAATVADGPGGASASRAAPKDDRELSAVRMCSVQARRYEQQQKARFVFVCDRCIYVRGGGGRAWRTREVGGGGGAEDEGVGGRGAG